MRVDEVVPEGLSEVRESICAEALEHVGKKEEPWGSNRGEIETFFPRWMKRRLQRRDKKVGRLVKGPAWCAFCTCTIWNNALGYHPFGHNIGSVHRLVEKAHEKHVWLSNPFDEEDAPPDFWLGPSPGDAFVMLKHPFKPGRRTTGHIGIILRVSEDGKSFNCVEGNSGHAVRFTVRRIEDTAQFAGVISVGLEDEMVPSYETGILDAEEAGDLGIT